MALAITHGNERNSREALMLLGYEYIGQAEILGGQIKKLNKRLAQLGDSRCSKEAYRIKSDLCVLYRQKREALETARTLINYYDKEELQLCAGGVVPA